MDDDALIKILVGPAYANETADEAATRKERILGAMFGRLSPVESRGMWLRISRERTGDPLSEAFARFPSKLRERLMAVLLDERRMKAAAGAR
jgi:hypothetical protein